MSASACFVAHITGVSPWVSWVMDRRRTPTESPHTAFDGPLSAATVLVAQLVEQRHSIRAARRRRRRLIGPPAIVAVADMFC